MQDVGYCALSIDLSDLHDIAILCEIDNAFIIRIHFLTAWSVCFRLVGTETNTQKGKMFCMSKFGLAEPFYEKYTQLHLGGNSDTWPRRDRAWRGVWPGCSGISAKLAFFKQILHCKVAWLAQCSILSVLTLWERSVDCSEHKGTTPRGAPPQKRLHPVKPA